MRFIGIDPGVSGGMALIDEIDGVETTGMTADNFQGIHDWLRYRTENTSGGCRVALEQVTGFIAGGEGRQPGSAMFNFGVNYGAVQMALCTCGFEDGVTQFMVPPKTWQSAVGMPPKIKGEKQHVWKGRLKARAQMLFPSIYITLHTADAILIALYCKMKYLKKVK